MKSIAVASLLLVTTTAWAAPTTWRPVHIGNDPGHVTVVKEGNGSGTVRRPGHVTNSEEGPFEGGILLKASATNTWKPGQTIIDPPRRPIIISRAMDGKGSTAEDWIVRNSITQVDWRVTGAPATVEQAGGTLFAEEDEIVRGQNAEVVAANEKPSFLDSANYDPASPDAEAFLEAVDAAYEQATGVSSHPTGKTEDRGDIDLSGKGAYMVGNEGLIQKSAMNGYPCTYRSNCYVWARVNKRSQTITVTVGGKVVIQGLTSTGTPGRGTPNFDKHPDGRIYTKYSSRKFPGGDWNGLGNMPYAVFIRGGYAIHGTPSIGRLGRVASHGCIRTHPSQTAKPFNALVRQYGVANTWITVE